MTPYYADDLVTLYRGDCRDVLPSLPDGSIDAVITDPPYGLGFMGKAWDANFTPADVPMRRSPALDAVNAGAARPGGRQRAALDCQRRRARDSRDFGAWCEQWAAECLRVLKPGGHLLAFGGSRTWHRLACAVEDVGFEVRDSIAWLYGSGFPKSLDVSKAIDKLDATDERRTRALTFTAWMRSTGITAAQINDITGTNMASHYLTDREQPSVATADLFDLLRPHLPEVPAHIEELVRERTVESRNYAARRVVGERTTGIGTGRGPVSYIGDSEDRDVTAPHTADATRWQGWGTSLKPAFEPIVVARKPLAGTVAANVLAHGTGAINIDACRVASSDEDKAAHAAAAAWASHGERHGGKRADGSTAKANEVFGVYGNEPSQPHDLGRWPTNVVLDESQADELDRQSGTRTSGTNPVRRGSDKFRDAYGDFRGQQQCTPARGADTGGASRFFPIFRYEAKAPTEERPRVGDTAHSTVKPLDLMRWLVRLVTPPGGTVLEPFAGSGTTAEACVIEGFRCIAVERETDYLPLIVARLTKPIQPDLFGGAA